MALTHLFFDFFGTLVRYSSSRTEQGYDASYHLVREAGAEFEYSAFLRLWDSVADRFEQQAEQSLLEFSMQQVCGSFLEQALDRPVSSALIARFVETYIAEWNSGVEYLEGVPALLDRLAARYTLGVITNTHEASLVADHLERMGVARAFDAVLTSVEFGRRKPHTEIFAAALRQLGARAEHSAYIGDSFRPDYLGPQQAGMRALLIDPQQAAPIRDADRIANLLELERALDQGAA